MQLFTLKGSELGGPIIMPDQFRTKLKVFTNLSQIPIFGLELSTGTSGEEISTMMPTSSLQMMDDAFWTTSSHQMYVSLEGAGLAMPLPNAFLPSNTSEIFVSLVRFERK